MLDAALFGEMFGECVVWFDEDEEDDELDMVEPDCDGDDLRPVERPRMSAIENLLAVFEFPLFDEWCDWATATAAADMASANELGKLNWFENVFKASIVAAAAFAAAVADVFVSAAFANSAFSLFAVLLEWPPFVGVASELFFDLLAEHVGDVDGEWAPLMVVESDDGDDEFDDSELFRAMDDAGSCALLVAWVPFIFNEESIE